MCAAVPLKNCINCLRLHLVSDTNVWLLRMAGEEDRPPVLASVEEATAFVAGKFRQKVIKVADWLFYSASLVTVVVVVLALMLMLLKHRLL